MSEQNSRLWNCDHGAPLYARCKDCEIESLTARLAEAEQQALEQARLNGMDSEREARLMAKLAEAEREWDEAQASLKRVQAAAITGMNAAKAISSAQLVEAARLRADSSPEAIASQREANELLTNENDELRAEVARLKEASFSPGEMYCAKCNFGLIRTNLYIGSGTTGPGDNSTEPCPNGCGPLWPVTWEKTARDSWKVAEEIAEREQAEKQARASAESRLAALREAMEWFADYRNYEEPEAIAAVCKINRVWSEGIGRAQAAIAKSVEQ